MSETLDLIGLSSMSAVRIDGPDAERFAQAQFMNDVQALPVGRWQWSGWLTPKGRLIALFLLARPAEEQLRLLLPDHPASELAPALQRMLFRLKATVSVDAAVVGGQRVDAACQRGELRASAIGLQLALGDGRALWLCDAPLPGNADAEAIWRDADLAAGIPRLSAAQSGQWTPHMLSLDRLDAFSVKKGCYPGQEIVARTHFLGQSKRGLKWASLATQAHDAPLTEGGNVQDEAGREVGSIIAVDRFGTAGLAVVPVDLTTARVAERMLALKSFD